MYKQTVLDNGLRMLTSNMPHVRSVSISFFIGVGARYEEAEQSGTSHYVEHLLFKGTQQRQTANDICEAIEAVGGVFNGGTDKEITVYWAKVTNEHLPLALDVLADVIRCSRMDEADVEKERQVIIEEINMSMDSPHQRVNMLIDEVIWPEQSLGRDVAGSKETVQAADRNQLIDFWKAHYVPSQTVISVAGDMEHQEVETAVHGLLSDWKDGQHSKWFPAIDSQDAPRLIVEAKDTEQAHVCLGLRGLSILHPDRFILNILNIVLGEGMSCRLFREIRENLGLAYDIHSYVSHFKDSGSLVVYGGISPKNVEPLIQAVLTELVKLKDNLVPETELSKAKEMAKGRLLLRMEDSRSVSSWNGGQEIMLGKIKSVDEMVSIIEAITADDLKRVAGDLVLSNGLNLAAVGPHLNENRLKDLLVL